MGNRSVDALQCFSFLADNVPSWITALEGLVSHTAAKHAEFAAEYARLDTATTSRPKRRKNSSIHSIRPDESAASIRDIQPSTKPEENEEESYLDPLTLLRVSKRYPREAGAHRRKDDVDTGNANDPNQPPRQQRPQVVVHYDSHTQNVLEQLVRDIGGARNNIRKGRMSHMIKTGFGFRAMAEDKPRFRDVKSQFNTSTKAGYQMPPTFSPSRKDSSPFESADKQLELAQSFCETAAHQFLRNGDCASELQKTKERFSNVIDLAKEEVEHLKAAREQEEANKKQQQQERQQQQQQKEDEEEVGLIPSKYKKEEVVKPILPDPDLEVEPKQPVDKIKDVDKNPAGMLTAIEVDDASSSSSISIDITAFRSTRFRS